MTGHASDRQRCEWRTYPLHVHCKKNADTQSLVPLKCELRSFHFAVLPHVAAIYLILFSARVTNVRFCQSCA